jgi:hypothetical protein
MVADAPAPPSDPAAGPLPGAPGEAPPVRAVTTELGPQAAVYPAGAAPTPVAAAQASEAGLGLSQEFGAAAQQREYPQEPGRQEYAAAPGTSPFGPQSTPPGLPPWVAAAMAQAGDGSVRFGAPPGEPETGAQETGAQEYGAQQPSPFGDFTFPPLTPPAAPDAEQPRRRMGRIGAPETGEPSEGADPERGAAPPTPSASPRPGPAAPAVNPAAPFYTHYSDSDPDDDGDDPGDEQDATAEDFDEADDAADRDDFADEGADAMSDHLYERLRDRLRRELLVDRERSLTLTDWR